MNKKGEFGLGGIIIVFITIVVAIALLAPIFNTQSLLTTKQTTTNQSVSAVSAFVDSNNVDTSVNLSIYSQSNWKVKECPLTSVVIRNGVGTALVSGTDYNLDANNGLFSLLNTTKTIPSVSLNQTYTDYKYCADGYNTNGGSRGVASFIGLFAVLALLVVIIWQTDLINSLK